LRKAFLFEVVTLVGGDVGGQRGQHLHRLTLPVAILNRPASHNPVRGRTAVSRRSAAPSFRHPVLRQRHSGALITAERNLAQILHPFGLDQELHQPDERAPVAFVHQLPQLCFTLLSQQPARAVMTAQLCVG
jgi:hypothetical protein